MKNRLTWSNSRDFANLSPQRRGIERLDHIIGGTRIQSFRNMGGITLSGDDQEMNIPRVGGAAHRAKQIHSRHAGHVPVRDHQVDRRLASLDCRADELPGDIAILGLDDVAVTGLLEHVPQDQADGWHVVHDEDAKRLSHPGILP